MNDNNFDSNRNESANRSQSEFDGFDVYSKQYIPEEGGYTEQRQRYSSSRRDETRQMIRRKNRRMVAIVALTLAVVLLCSGAIVGAAHVAFDYYGDLYEQRVSEWEKNQDKTPSSGKETENVGPVVDETEKETETDVFFASDDETQVSRSESTSSVKVDGKIGDADLTKADVVALVADSVVEITTSETYRNGLVYQSGAGSGVIINESGVILTNNHVVESASKISVRLTNGNIYEASLVAADSDSDIAVLKIKPTEPLTVAVLGNSDGLIVGEEVLAIGNPLGLLGGTVTNGIVSALEREVTISGETMTLLQHNAAISPGNSGGALFNMRGELIGIVNAKYSTSEAEGLGFAIPINTVLEVYDDLIQFGYVKGRADHGLTFTTDRFYMYLYIYSSRYTDQLQYGDRLLAIDGKAPTSIEEAYALLDAYEIGDTVEIVVARNGKQVTVALEIREYTPLQ